MYKKEEFSAPEILLFFEENYRAVSYTHLTLPTT